MRQNALGGVCVALRKRKPAVCSSAAVALRLGELGNPDARWRGKYHCNKVLGIMEGRNRRCTKQVEVPRLLRFLRQLTAAQTPP